RDIAHAACKCLFWQRVEDDLGALVERDPADIGLVDIDLELKLAHIDQLNGRFGQNAAAGVERKRSCYSALLQIELRYGAIEGRVQLGVLAAELSLLHCRLGTGDVCGGDLLR